MLALWDRPYLLWS